MKKTYSVSAKVWLYPGMALGQGSGQAGAWYFVTIPKNTTKDIDYFFSHAKKGWGSLPVTVTLGTTSWKTSIFPDKKIGSYLLPLKADVRKKEEIKEGDSIKFSLKIADL